MSLDSTQQPSDTPRASQLLQSPDLNYLDIVQPAAPGSAPQPEMYASLSRIPDRPLRDSLQLERNPAEDQRTQLRESVVTDALGGTIGNNFFNLIRGEFSRGSAQAEMGGAEGAAIAAGGAAAIDAAVAYINRRLARAGAAAEIRLTPVTAEQEANMRRAAMQAGRPAPDYIRQMTVVDPATGNPLEGSRPLFIQLSRRPRP